MMEVIILIVLFVIAILVKLIPLIWYGISFLFSHCLFNPKVNSFLSIIGYILVIILSDFPIIIKILWAVCIIDCIRDIIISDKYYEKLTEYRSDNFYALKSISSLLTLGLSRIVFLSAVNLWFIWSVSSYFKKKKVILCNNYYNENGLTGFQYYCVMLEDYTSKALENGEILTNKQTILGEIDQSKKKIDKYKSNIYKDTPSKLSQTFLEMLTKEGREMRKERSEIHFIKRKKSDNAQQKISEYQKSDSSIYVDKHFFEYCKGEISKALETKGTLSVKDICKLSEVQALLHFPESQLTETVIYFFVVFMLKSLVKDGVLEENDLSDNLLENFQYKHVNGKVMKSTDISELLALDD